MFKKILILMLAVMILLNTACSGNAGERRPGIEITGITSSIGAVGNNTANMEEQSFSYIVTLKNNEPQELSILSIEPVLSAGFRERALGGTAPVQVNGVIPAGGSMEVSGEITFDAKGLSKEQIIDMEPFVVEVEITEGRTVKKPF